MSGKKSAAPAKPKAAAAKSAGATNKAVSEKPAVSAADKATKSATTTKATIPAKSTAAPKAPAAEVTPENTDPFAVDAELVKKIPTMRKVADKKSTLEIKCPMCETIGYVPETMAGRDIKCYNPACMAPIFRVPIKVDKEAIVEDPGFLVKNGVKIGAAALVAVIAIGSLIVFLNSEGPPKEKEDEIVRPQDNRPIVDPTAKSEFNENKVQTSKPSTEDGLLTFLMTNLPDFSSSADNAYHKSLGYEFLVEQLITLNKPQEAQANFNILKSIAGDKKHFLIAPYVQMAWQALAEKKSEQAEQAVGSALATWEQISKNGREAADDSRRLAAILVATNRMSDAQKVMQDVLTVRQEKSVIDWAVYQNALDLGYLNFAEEYHKKMAVDLGDRLGRLIAPILMKHGFKDKALEWCRAAGNPRDQLARHLDLCSYIAYPPKTTTQTSNIDGVTEIVAGLPVAEQALIWAHLAHVGLNLKQNEAATRCFGTATEITKTWPAPTAIPMPTLQEIYFQRFKHTNQIHQATTCALALSELSICEAKLLHPMEAWTYVEQAVKMAQLATPASGLLQGKLNEVRNQSRMVESQLIEELKLRPQDSLSAFNQYRRNIFVLEEELKFSQFLTSEIVNTGVREKLQEQAWIWFNNGEGKSLYDAGQLSQEVPGTIWVAMLIQQQEVPPDLKQLISTGKVEKPRQWELQNHCDWKVRDPVNGFKLILGDGRDNKGLLSDKGAAFTADDLFITLYSTSLIAEQSKPEVFFQWLKAMPGVQLLRENVIVYGTAQYAGRGLGPDFWVQYQLNSPTVNEKISVVSGLIHGMLQRGVTMKVPDAPKAPQAPDAPKQTGTTPAPKK
jgi:hypothetical protein